MASEIRVGLRVVWYTKYGQEAPKESHWQWDLHYEVRKPLRMGRKTKDIYIEKERERERDPTRELVVGS